MLGLGINMDRVLATHTISLNPEDNGGEVILLNTLFYANGDPITEKTGVYITQEVTMHSYCNSASFNLIGAHFTPEFLRKWANELEQTRNKLIK